MVGNDQQHLTTSNQGAHCIFSTCNGVTFACGEEWQCLN